MFIGVGRSSFYDCISHNIETISEFQIIHIIIYLNIQHFLKNYSRLEVKTLKDEKKYKANKSQWLPIQIQWSEKKMLSIRFSSAIKMTKWFLILFFVYFIMKCLIICIPPHARIQEMFCSHIRRLVVDILDGGAGRGNREYKMELAWWPLKVNSM